jgi:glutathione S-transferase
MLRIVIANKNYSSWSLRPWLLLRHLDIAFEEVTLKLETAEFSAAIGRYSPARRVPVLLDGDFAVWDTLAIVEYLHEAFPHKHVWPAERQARARARSICAEMHSGFGALRSAWPMNVTARLPGLGWSLAVAADLERITSIWNELLERHGGPFLFGAFCAADAFYAPVASRLQTYGVAIEGAAAQYRDTVLALPAMKEWGAAAAREPEYVASDEPYRKTRQG